MKSLLVLVLFAFSLNAVAYTVTEVDPVPPAGAGIPATALRYVDCVAINANGVAVCNVVYTWSSYINRFCCRYQRDLAVTVARGNVTFLVPAVGKTDTRAYGINDVGDIAGTSMGAKATLQQATIWSGGVPNPVAGELVTAISNDGRAIVDGQILHRATGVVETDPLVTRVFALNDKGSAVGWVVDSDPTSEHVGLARLPYKPDDDTAQLLTQLEPFAVAYNDASTVVYTLAFGSYPPLGFFSVLGKPTRLVDGTLTGINDRGHRVGTLNGVGGVAWIRGVAVNLSTVTGFPIARAAAISNNGVIVGQIARGTKRNGAVLTP